MDELIERLGSALPSRYQLVRKIGRGGAAHVFLARESEPERDVAIKVLDPALATLVGPERFIREVDFASKMAHPHILPVFAAGESCGFLYYVMPYVPEQTLRERLHKERFLPVPQAVEIAREVADALGYAHERNIAHRDIKPENILLEANHAIVADFGIARAIADTGGEPPITQSGFVVGTPAYMSPEQTTGEGTVDGRTDVYSLGCVLYEMLTGQPPHRGTPEKILVEKLKGPHVPVSILRPEVPTAVEAVVSTALALDPSARFPTGVEFRDALGSALTPDPAAGVGSSQPTARLAGRARAMGTEVPSPGARSGILPILNSRASLTFVLAAVVAVNWLQTTVDTWIGGNVAWVAWLGHQMADAMRWLEGGLSFAGQEATSPLAVYGYAAAYFFLFPLLAVMVAVALARRRTIGPYRTLTTALVAVYALCLPFYILVPVPERWSVAESQAILLSDRWSTSLIEAVRPLSGLDNCFPSFHVSLMVITILAAFTYRLACRRTALIGGIVVIVSTIVLGIHWAADVIAGISVALISWSIAMRLERRWTMRPGRHASAARAMALIVAALAVFWPAPASAQTSVSFLGVALDADSRHADAELQRYLERTGDVRFVSEQAYEYRNVIDRLVSWRADRGPLLARVTPYALVASELLGADVQVLATYVSRATGGTTYHSYFVVNRRRFPQMTDLALVPRYLREAASPPRFAYHREFSTSSYFLPALYFRNHGIFDMPSSTEHATAIQAQRVAGGTMDVIRSVATGQHDVAAVWSGTKATVEGTDSLAARYGRHLRFIQLPTALPNDLLVVSASMDSVTRERISQAISGMRPDEIDVGDFMTWRNISDAQDASAALADVRWLAQESPAPATIDIQRITVGGRTVPDDQLLAVRQAIRLAGLELVNFDRDFHALQDYVWTVEPIHDGAVMLRSRVVGADLENQEFQLSFRDTEELTDRVVQLLHSRLHRIRYVWPYRTSPPTVLRNVPISVPTGVSVTVRKIHWLDMNRHSYLQDASFDATVAASDFHKIELSPDFIDPPDSDGFGFDPMSDISYRVVLARVPHERPLFRAFAVTLVVLLVVGGAAAALDLRQLISDART